MFVEGMERNGNSALLISDNILTALRYYIGNISKRSLKNAYTFHHKNNWTAIIHQALADRSRVNILPFLLSPKHDRQYVSLWKQAQRDTSEL